MNLYLVKRKEFSHDACVRAATLFGATEVYNSDFSSGETPHNVKFMMVDGPLCEIVSKSALEITGLLLEASTLNRIASNLVDREMGPKDREIAPVKVDNLCYEIRTQIESIESKLAQAKEYLDLVVSRVDLEE